MDNMILVAMKRAVEWDVPFTLLPRDTRDILAEIERLRKALKEIVEYNANEDYHRSWEQSVELLQDEAYSALKGGE